MALKTFKYRLYPSPSQENTLWHVLDACRNLYNMLLHKLSTALIRAFDGIGLEERRVRHMVKNRHLSKSILESCWALFKQYLVDKAGRAGREIRLVNPAYTSRCCSACGQMFEDFSLSTRWVRCDCGLSLDQDHNAAINILKNAGWDASVQGNVGCG